MQNNLRTLQLSLQSISSYCWNNVHMRSFIVALRYLYVMRLRRGITTCAHIFYSCPRLEGCASFTAKSRFVLNNTGSCPRQSHRITEGDRSQVTHSEVCTASALSTREHWTSIDYTSNEQECQQTTGTCSPFSGSPSHHIQYIFRALFYSHPQIQYRGLRLKAHWYMHQIIIIKEYLTLRHVTIVLSTASTDGISCFPPEPHLFSSPCCNTGRLTFGFLYTLIVRHVLWFRISALAINGFHPRKCLALATTTSTLWFDCFPQTSLSVGRSSDEPPTRAGVSWRQPHHILHQIFATQLISIHSLTSITSSLLDIVQSMK